MKFKIRVLLGVLFSIVLVISAGIVVSAEIVGGNCGPYDYDEKVYDNNLTWELNTDPGVLIISGEGEMQGGPPIGLIPWYSYGDEIISVVIENGVTTIGEIAFSGCANLKSIEIAQSVTLIEQSAFMDCVSLTEVVLPDSITAISPQLFQGCKNLTSVNIPSNVTSVGFLAFGGCNNLIQEENGVSYVDDWVVGDPYSSSGNVVLRDGTVGIAEMSFWNNKWLTSVVIPNSVFFINEAAFAYCDNLKSVDIPNSVISIGEEAFFKCLGLKNLYIPNRVMYIGEDAFYGCGSIETISVQNDNPVYHSYGNCLIETGSQRLLLGCENSIIPADGTVKFIGDHAFYGCENLKEILIPDDIVSIGDYAFYNCNSLKGIFIPDSVTHVGDRAFWNCSSLENIVIGKGVSFIGGTFDYCENICSIVVANGNEKYHSYGNCLIDTKEKNLVLGCKNSIIPADGSVVSIGASAFSYCKGLVNITIPDQIQAIHNNAFSHCENLISVVLPNGIEVIPYGAFSSCYNLTSVIIPNTISSIEMFAFLACNRLAEITYCGSAIQWESVGKENDWDVETGDYVILYHSWDQGVITKFPTHTTYGTKTITCAFCGDKKSEIINKISEHVYSDWIIEDEKQHKIKCVCGDVRYFQHSYDDDQDFFCNDCGYKRGVDAPPTLDTGIPSGTTEDDANPLNPSLPTDAETEKKQTAKALRWGCKSNIAFDELMLLLSIGAAGVCLKKKES